MTAVKQSEGSNDISHVSSECTMPAPTVTADQWTMRKWPIWSLTSVVLGDLRVWLASLTMPPGLGRTISWFTDVKSDVFRNDVDDVVGCEKFRFAYADDEMMMNAEAGLYFKFDVDQGGIPINCPGLENFNMETWIGKNGDPSRVKDTERRAYHTDCPLNERSLPENDKPVSQIIADYAHDQVS